MRAAIVIQVLGLAILGCRPQTATPPPPAPGVATREDPAPAEPEPAVPPSTSSASSVSSASSDAEQGSNAAAPAPPEPPPPQSVIPIVLPFPEDAFVIQAVTDQSPIVLFEDEHSPIRRGVGKALRKDGLPVVPVDRLEHIESEAAAGRLVLEGDQTCRAPLSRADVMERYFSRSRRASVETLCIDDCRIMVSLTDPEDEDYYQDYQSRPVSRPHDPRAWARAKVRRTKRGFLVGGLGLIGSSHPPPIRFQWFDSIGPWSPKPSEELVSEAQGKAARCAHPDPRMGMTYDVRAAVGTDGRVTRCTARSEHSQAQGGACICSAIESVRAPAGKAGRRFYVEAQDTGGFSSLEDTVKAVQANTDAWIRRIREARVLTACMAEHDPGGDFVATALLHLAADGTVSDVEIIGDITTMPRMTLSSCLVRGLLTVPMPCRPPGVEVLQVKIDIQREQGG